MFSYNIKRIFFRNIRNFNDFELNILDNKSLIIIGDNGKGKTSIIEAISLIYGRGIRETLYQEIANYNNPIKEWFSTIVLSDGDYQNTITAEYKNNKKTIKINDKIAKNFSQVLEYVRMLWVTQDDYHNFLSSSSYRRKFLDRIIIQIIPNFYEYLIQYQHYISERNKILSIGQLNDDWLNELEKKIAKFNILIKNSRNDVINDFNNFNNNSSNSWKFLPKIKISGLLEDENFSEEELLNYLKRNRNLHMQIKRSNIGVHLSKVNIVDANKDLSIDLFSSGEQRLFLNKFIIDFAQMQIEKKHYKPILLLDDILTFFDGKNQNLLMEELLKLNTQFFITTNNMKLESDILNKLYVYEI